MYLNDKDNFSNKTTLQSYIELLVINKIFNLLKRHSKTHSYDHIFFHNFCISVQG